MEQNHYLNLEWGETIKAVHMLKKTSEDFNIC